MGGKKIKKQKKSTLADKNIQNYSDLVNKLGEWILNYNFCKVVEAGQPYEQLLLQFRDRIVVAVNSAENAATP